MFKNLWELFVAITIIVSSIFAIPIGMLSTKIAYTIVSYIDTIIFQ